MRHYDPDRYELKPRVSPWVRVGQIFAVAFLSLLVFALFIVSTMV